MANRNLNAEELNQAHMLFDEIRQKLRMLAGDDLQHGKCAHCNEEMAIQYSELDRKNAVDGYTIENTELVQAKCHRDRQAAKGYT